MAEETALATIVNTEAPVSQYDRILDIAIRQEAPLEQLEKWMDLKRRYEADEAKKAFYSALADFHQEKIVIKKDKYNSMFKSWYCSLGNLLGTVGPIMGEHGLSVRFIPTQGNDIVTVECVLQHKLGHTESVTMSAPPDKTGGNSKNPIQQIKSTFTYLRSATFEAVTGLSGTEASSEDDDGNGSAVEAYVDGEDLEHIKKLVEQTKSNNKQFLKFAGATSIDTIPVGNLTKVLSSLNNKRVKMSQVIEEREPGSDDE